MFEDLEKQTIIIDEMINPTFFENDLSNFPITWDQVKTWTYDEVIELDPDSIMSVYDDYNDVTSEFSL